MKSDWKNTTLEAIAAQGVHGFVDGPFGSNLPASSYTKSGVPVIRGANLSLGIEKFRMYDFVFVNEDTAARLARSLCQPNDIVFTKKGTLGQSGIIPTGGYDRYLLSSNQMKLSVDITVADPLYVYFYVSSAASRKKILRDSESTGVPKTNLAYFKSFPITLPPLKEQKAIAHILGTLDDKIELNRQTNKTLESIARAIFKSWFVDFDPVKAKRDGKTADLSLSPDILDLFPDSFQDSQMGEIPAGWEVDLFSNAVELLSGGTPKTTVDQYWNGDIPWYTVKDIPNDSDVWVINTDKHISQSGLKNSPASVFKAGTSIISARGTVGKVCLTGVEMAMNQSCYGVLGGKGFGTYFTYFNLVRFVDLLKQNSHGSVFSTITKDTFKSISSVYPDLQLANRFETVAEPFLQKMLQNGHESNTLKILRDTLLPKLISGELRIKDAEKFLKDAPL